MNLASLLAAIHADPSDDLLWSAIADRLEEQGEPDRAELTRLTHLLRRHVRVPDRSAQETRMRDLLASGVEPCVAEITNSIGMRWSASHRASSSWARLRMRRSAKKMKGRSGR